MRQTQELSYFCPFPFSLHVSFVFFVLSVFMEPVSARGSWTWIAGNSSYSSASFLTAPARSLFAAYWMDSNESLSIFGGYDGTTETNSMFQFDYNTNNWMWT